jgi:hypothetical protein
VNEAGHRYRSCTVKVRHATAADAFWASLQIWKYKRGHAWPYLCKFGADHFHCGRIPFPVKAFIDELMLSEEFLRMQGFTVRPLMVKAYEPARVH